jgi:hypothetical protein
MATPALVPGLQADFGIASVTGQNSARHLDEVEIQRPVPVPSEPDFDRRQVEMRRAPVLLQRTALTARKVRKLGWANKLLRRGIEADAVAPNRIDPCSRMQRNAEHEEIGGTLQSELSAARATLYRYICCSGGAGRIGEQRGSEKHQHKTRFAHKCAEQDRVLVCNHLPPFVL